MGWVLALVLSLERPKSERWHRCEGDDESTNLASPRRCDVRGSLVEAKAQEEVRAMGTFRRATVDHPIEVARSAVRIGSVKRARGRDRDIRFPAIVPRPEGREKLLRSPRRSSSERGSGRCAEQSSESRSPAYGSGHDACVRTTTKPPRRLDRRHAVRHRINGVVAVD